MNIVLIIPTGLGAEIGGHAGDGNAVAKLMASTCEHLITHPNVVNLIKTLLNMNVRYVAMFMTLKKATRRTASSPALHGKTCQTIGFAPFVVRVKTILRKWNKH